MKDIGKAMDHSKDGGHAVIGAEFIENTVKLRTSCTQSKRITMTNNRAAISRS